MRSARVAVSRSSMNRFRAAGALCGLFSAVACGATPPPESPSEPVPAAEIVPVPVPASAPEAAEGPAGAAPAPGADAEEPAAAEEAEAAGPTSGASRAGVGTGAAKEVVGTLVSRRGDELTVELSDAPKVGGKAVLYKRFEQEIGPIKATGWLAIADVTVKKVDGRKVVLAISAEKSNIVVNGKKLDHFTSGAEVKLDASP